MINREAYSYWYRQINNPFVLYKIKNCVFDEGYHYVILENLPRIREDVFIQQFLIVKELP